MTGTTTIGTQLGESNAISSEAEVPTPRVEQVFADTTSRIAVSPKNVPIPSINHPIQFPGRRIASTYPITGNIANERTKLMSPSGLPAPGGLIEEARNAKTSPIAKLAIVTTPKTRASRIERRERPTV